ncbi:MAG: response regulator transcription factor [Candidatus Limnocylindrales bacterium]
MAGALSQEALPVRVAIVDDHPVVGEGTAAVLRSQSDITVTGVAPSLEAAEAAGLFDGERVDVVLLDIRLGTDSGLRALTVDDKAVGSTGERPAIIVLTAYDYPQYADAALRLGAAGFVLKTAPIAELVDAIRRVAAGGLAFSVRPSPTRGSRLSAREHDVVRLVADGRTNDEIGASLSIGSKTVETHLARLFERLGVASRTELAMRAVREGWLDVPPGER